MLNLLTVVPGKKRKTPSGWYVVNAVCCQHRGHRPDKRKRGGILITDTEQRWSCFNCNFKCTFTLGKPIGYNLRLLLQWCGIDDSQISKWSFESLQSRDLVEVLVQKKYNPKIQSDFPETQLPVGSIPIDSQRSEHKKYVDYLNSRGFSLNDYNFKITPNDPLLRNRNRIIIPCTYNGINVGHTSRYMDNVTPKYVKEHPPGYVFGIDLQKKKWESCIVVEGTIDALSIDGCALQHNDISREQAELLNAMNKRIIIVPDQDQSGFEIIERALEMGYQISIPDWGKDCKDINDATRKYGRLPTLMSILQAATSNRIKLQMSLRHHGVSLKV